MSLLDRINYFFQGHRGVTGALLDPSGFWDQIERTALLLSRLQDNDINWAIPSVYLRGLTKFFIDLGQRTRSGELEATIRIYAAWCAIHKEISDYNDFEVDTWWTYRLKAAGDNIIERVFPLLHKTDFYYLESELPVIHRCINRDVIYDSSTVRSNNVHIMVNSQILKERLLNG